MQFYLVNTDQESSEGPFGAGELSDKLATFDEEEREGMFVFTLFEDGSSTVEQAETWFESNDGSDDDED